MEYQSHAPEKSLRNNPVSMVARPLSPSAVVNLIFVDEINN